MEVQWELQRGGRSGLSERETGHKHLVECICSRRHMLSRDMVVLNQLLANDEDRANGRRVVGLLQVPSSKAKAF